MTFTATQLTLVAQSHDGARAITWRPVTAVPADAMVVAPNDLGQQLWRAHGYQPQQDWRRWVKPI
jgi:hypothetical protein